MSDALGCVLLGPDDEAFRLRCAGWNTRIVHRPDYVVAAQTPQHVQDAVRFAAERAPELRLLHRWVDTWSGLGAMVAGLHRLGYDLHLTQYGDDTWRATFFVTGFAHSIVGGSAWEPTPWTAVQRAAWAALKRTGQPGS